MSEVTLIINNKSYNLACDEGQEQRVRDVGHYLDLRLKDMARAGAAQNENHLMVLTGLLLADEVFELREGVNGHAQTGAYQEQYSAPEGFSFEQEVAHLEEIRAKDIQDHEVRMHKLALEEEKLNSIRQSLEQEQLQLEKEKAELRAYEESLTEPVAPSQERQSFQDETELSKYIDSLSGRIDVACGRLEKV